MHTPRWWTLSYDIGDARRRRRLAQTAERLGDRVQKSLFVLGLTAEQQHALCGSIDRLHHPQQDRIMLRPMCPACLAATTTMGQGGHPERELPYWII